MSNTKRASLDELRAMKDRGEIASPTESAEAVDLPDDFWANAEIETPKAKIAISMRVDPDVLEYFKGQGNGHLTRMHAVLRAYVDAHKKLHS
ncbi:BrnA antitoxin family protein [Octadecabacter sp. CECT 8868]|uniref:BrnA antitoxin family protein n=1 Tax=Octadecabacter algicola TaxID=2909342 RepID=UPI001F192167|nr:BrnA antitoxin family protein [Octadecabacter algicola]MCF2905659.1 BrnA antitoxin family protein [Octadecabacter algicola]